MTRDPQGQTHRKSRRAIAAHFASPRFFGLPFSASATAAAEQEMRTHLRVCAECLDDYQRHLTIAAFDPAAVPVEQRLARGLGLSSRRPRRVPVWFGMGAFAGAAVAALVLMVGVARPKGDAHDGSGSFTARGLPVASTPEITVYRLPSRDARPEPAAGVVSSRDELAFAYRNAGDKGWLLIFAVDEHGHVFWYHPGWSDIGDDPGAVAISVGPGLHELPTAVAHKFDGERVVLHALFTARSMTVRQVEAAVQASVGAEAVGADRSGGILAIPDAVDVRRPFKVVP